jgi:phage baseplate assembly protein W
MNIDYPFHFDSRGHSAGANNYDHIREMIEQMLFTNPGERVNRPDFGGGLQRLIFGPASPELAAALKFSIQATLQRHLGDLIELQTMEVSSQESTINILIQYVVRRTNQQQTAQFTRTV